MRVILYTGKGGVGKTTVAAAVTARSARSEARTAGVRKRCALREPGALVFFLQ